MVTLEERPENEQRFMFRLYNGMTGETVCLVRLDESVVADPNVIDPETLTLRPLPNGGIWSLVPLDEREPQINSLASMKRYLDMLTKQPCPLFSSYIGKMDAFIQACMSLFGEYDYIEITDPARELTFLINPAKAHKEGWEPTVKKRSVLVGMLEEVLQRAGELKDHHGVSDPQEPEDCSGDKCDHQHQ